MDPDKALADLRKALAAYLAAVPLGNHREAIGHANDFAEAFEALDDWMSKGGFPPRAWAQRAL